MLNRSSNLGGSVRPYFGGRAPVGSKPPVRVASEAAPRPAETVPRPAERQKPSSSLPPAQRRAKAKKEPPTIQALVRAAASAAGWGILEMGADLQIDVRTRENRSQIVSITFDTADREGFPVTVVSSICGPLHERSAAPLLRYNAKLSYGAFVAERMADRQEMVVLRATLPAACNDQDAIGRIIAEIASRADKVESKLTGRDQF